MPWFLLPASLWCDLGSLSPDEGNEVLVDEEDKSQAGNLGRRERWLSLAVGQSHIHGPVCQAQVRHPPLSPAHLHHRVVAKAPLGATQHRPPIDIDGPPALVSNEEVTIVFQLDDTCRCRK